jgi:hypothetical protein
MAKSFSKVVMYHEASSRKRSKIGREAMLKRGIPMKNREHLGFFFYHVEDISSRECFIIGEIRRLNAGKCLLYRPVAHAERSSDHMI